MGVCNLCVALEGRLDKIKPATTCLCGLSLRTCVMVGAVFMTLSGCVMIVHSPLAGVRVFQSLMEGADRTSMSSWAFVYVHVYLICLHLLTTVFLLYAVPLSLLALRSAWMYDAAYLRSYFRLNLWVALMLVGGSWFNLMLDDRLCEFRAERADPAYPAEYDDLNAHSYVLTAVDASAGQAARDDYADGCDKSAAANFAQLVLFLLLAVVTCYLAWITYCYRRELEQGSQLDEDGAACAAEYGAEPHRDPRMAPHRPMGAAQDVEIPGR